MSFIRAEKFSNGRVYYYLVESYREGGKVKQRVLQYLGKNPGGHRSAQKRVKGASAPPLL